MTEDIPELASGELREELHDTLFERMPRHIRMEQWEESQRKDVILRSKKRSNEVHRD